MAEERNSSVVLLSIKPEHYEKIVQGEKRIEFRRSFTKRHISHVVLYVTKPKQSICLYFNVGRIDEKSPHALWRRYKDCGGLSQSEFKKYFNGAAKSIAIGIGEMVEMKKPISLQRLTSISVAPQNFAYLSKRDFELIKRHSSL